MEPFDLVVVGGGVNGAGIARDAAGRGLKRPAVRAGRPRPGHLVAQRQAGPWRAALPRILRVPAGPRGADRARGAAAGGAAHRLADALRAAARAGRCGRPGWSGWACSSTTIWAAASCCRRPARSICAAHPEGRPLKPEYRKGFEYSDCWVDDARLVVLNALDAQAKGAEILTRTALVGARRDGWLVGGRAGGPPRRQPPAGGGTRPRQRRRPLGRAGAEPRGRHQQQPARPPGQGQPPGHAQVLGRQPSLPAAEHRQAGDLRQPLRGRPGADRHHRHPGRGRARGRGDRAGRDRLPAGRARPLLHRPAGAGRHRPQLQRRPAALRRQCRESVGGHARLRLRRRAQGAGGRAGAAPVRVRRQDHHLPQARRARAGQAGAVLPAARPGLDRHCPAAGRRSARRRFRALARGFPGGPPLAAGAAGPALWPPLRQPRRGAAGRCRRPWPISAAISGRCCTSARPCS